MTIIKAISSLALSAAIAYLAYSLMAVSREVAQVRQQLPQVLNQIQTMEQDIDVAAWLQLGQQVNQSVSGINQHIPAVLTEVNALRTTTVPEVLAEVKAVRTTTVPNVLTEVKAVRLQTIPPVLKEMDATRKMIPGTLKEVNALIDKARKAGKHAAEGAVQGTVKGILMTPVDLLKDAGDAIDDALDGGNTKQPVKGK